MNKSNLTTVLKALYNFVTKRIGEVREAAAKAQTTADSKVTATEVNTLIDTKLGAIENGSY
jgi:hypothetical protein